MEIAAALTTLRLAARVTNGFLLDLLFVGRPYGDVIDGLIFTALLEPYLNHMADSARLGIEADVEPGIDTRAAASIGGVADSLGMPFETVRRRVARFQEHGVCIVNPRGVFVPRSTFNAPEFMSARRQIYGMVKDLYLRLRAAAAIVTHEDQSTGDAYPPDELEVLRHTLNFVLRAAEPLQRYFRTPLSGVILMEIMRQNTAHLPDSERGTEAEGSSGFVSDAQRRPARIGALAAQLGLSYETVRRHLSLLAADDHCLRIKGGVIVPATALAAPALTEIMSRNYVNLARLFGSFPDNALRVWEQETQSAAV